MLAPFFTKANNETAIDFSSQFSCVQGSLNTDVSETLALAQRRYTFVILLDITELPSLGVLFSEHNPPAPCEIVTSLLSCYK